MRLLRIGLALWLLACAGVAQAALTFPALTGRVVDTAQMIDPAVREQLTQQLQALEQSRGDQIVVVTVPDLQGVPIEDYGYQLGRHWGIGQKGKDNGALLIVARDERKLRIEVGYGLEGALTDAQSWVIINQVIAPKFKAGKFSQGISDGVAAMIQVVGGEPLAVPAHVADANFAKDNPGVFHRLVRPADRRVVAVQSPGPARVGDPVGDSQQQWPWRWRAAAVAAVVFAAAVAVSAVAGLRAAGDDNN